VCKKLIKNSQPFEKKCQKTAGGDFLTHTVHLKSYSIQKFTVADATVQVDSRLSEPRGLIEDLYNFMLMFNSDSVSHCFQDQDSVLLVENCEFSQSACICHCS